MECILHLVFSVLFSQYCYEFSPLATRIRRKLDIIDSIVIIRVSANIFFSSLLLSLLLVRSFALILSIYFSLSRLDFSLIFFFTARLSTLRQRRAHTRIQTYINTSIIPSSCIFCFGCLLLSSHHRLSYCRRRANIALLRTQKNKKKKKKFNNIIVCHPHLI